MIAPVAQLFDEGERFVGAHGEQGATEGAEFAGAGGGYFSHGGALPLADGRARGV